MAKEFLLTEEALEYNTAENPTNSDQRFLVAGSRNVLIDRQRKVRTRNGNSRLGAANATIMAVRQGVTWHTSTGTELPLRVYDDELEVYIGSLDDTTVDAWHRVQNAWSTTEIPRFTTWYDSSEGIDELIFVFGDDNLYEWNGAACVVSSVTATTITKAGTDTFAQNRFYTTGNKTVVNTRTGTEYAYTGGESTTTLTGIADTTGIIAGDVLVQKIVTTTNKPTADRNNHTIFTFENQVAVGSNEDNQVYISQNDDYTDFSYASPRAPGEGALLTLDGPAAAFGILTDQLVIFAGKNSVFSATPKEIALGTTLAETLAVKKYQTGALQGAQTQEATVQVGNSIVYLSHEPALRELVSLDEIQGGKDPRAFSNPIKPDFDAEDWDNAFAAWHRNAVYLTAPTNGRLYILEYVEDADGKLRRFWQPPQTMFIRPLAPYNGILYGHGATVPETYRLFDPDSYSDVNSSDQKVAIQCVAKYAYRNFGKRAQLKNFDEYFVEGEISPSTTIDTTIYYDYGGHTQVLQAQIDGSDQNILEETLVSTSLAQQPLGQEPLGGSVNAPEDAAKFRAIIELAKEDFFEIQATFETNDVDKYFAIIAHGPNAQMSKRQPNTIKI